MKAKQIAEFFAGDVAVVGGVEVGMIIGHISSPNHDGCVLFMDGSSPNGPCIKNYQDSLLTNETLALTFDVIDHDTVIGIADAYDVTLSKPWNQVFANKYAGYLAATGTTSPCKVVGYDTSSFLRIIVEPEHPNEFFVRPLKSVDVLTAKPTDETQVTGWYVDCVTAVTKPETKTLTDYPGTCPACASPAYIGLKLVSCSSFACVHADAKAMAGGIKAKVTIPKDFLLTTFIVSGNKGTP